MQERKVKQRKVKQGKIQQRKMQDPQDDNFHYGTLWDIT